MERRPATADEILAARAACPDEDVQVDDDALVSEIDDSPSVWVQSWIYVPKETT